jgi:hypothetical protein
MEFPRRSIRLFHKPQKHIKTLPPRTMHASSLFSSRMMFLRLLGKIPADMKRCPLILDFKVRHPRTCLRQYSLHNRSHTSAGSVQSSGGHSSHSPPNIYRQQAAPSQNQSFQFPASPHLPAHPVPHGSTNEYSSNGGGTGALGYSTSYSGISGTGGNSGGGVGSTFPVPQHASELDAHYWRNMFLELGFGGDVDSSPTNGSVNGVPTTMTAMAPTGGENIRSIGSSSSYHGGQSHTCQQPMQMHSNNGHSHHHHQSASQPPVTQSQSSYYHQPHQHQHQHHHHLHSSSAQPSPGYGQ